MIVEKIITVGNSKGIHARPASKIVALAKEFKSEIIINKDEDTVNAKSIMGVLMLAAPKGTILNIKAEGEDANCAINKLSELIEGEME